MINILSYVGMNMQSEVCLWTLLGLMRTIFDATLFKVNANLKQVWQMSMPAELSMPVQRVLRTMISGIMLVQCFTVYVYLASYIVLLYPVFLEERPTLVLPWLLLAAIRKLLCELTSLAMGLGTCVLLGPAKPPCIKFLVAKIATIMPAFYIWILFYSYYHALKMATAYKTFPIVLPPSGLDYGLELAVRRRCTKSLFGEEQLRKKLQAGFYADKPPSINITPRVKLNEAESTNASSSDIFSEDAAQDKDVLRPLSTIPKLADIGAYEDWFGSEIMVPRGDRILEQFVVMLLRIAAYMKNDGIESINSQMFNSALTATWATRENIEAMPTDVTDTPPLVGNSKGHTASYLRNYPQIFMKKLNTEAPQTERKMSQTKNTESTMIKGRFRTLSRISTKSYNSNETTSLESKRFVSDTIIDISSKKSSNEILKPKLNEKHSDKLIVPKKKQSHHEKSYDERVVEDVKKIIEETYDRYLVQSLNYSNLAYEKLRTEHQPEIKLMSGTNLATDEFLLTTIEEMIQSCSRHIAHNNDMSVKSRLSEQINDKVVTSSLNLDGKNLEVNSSDHTKETTDTIENLVQIKTENIKYEESKSPKGVDSEYVEIELVDSNNVTCIESTGTTNDIPEPFCIQELEPEKEQDKEPGVCINTDTAEVFTDVNLDNVTNDTENKDSIVTNSISIQPEIEGIGHDEKIVCSENVDLEAFVGTTSEETKESVNNNAETEEILNSPSNSQEINSLENTSKLPDETRK